MPNTLPSLLLLPPPPSHLTPASISAAYRPTITATASALKDLSTSTELLVVLPCPSLHGRLSAPRPQIYSEVQLLLGKLYSLICIVCAELGVDVDADTPGSIDARVLLLDYDGSQSFSADHGSAIDSFFSGPIVDLPIFALTRRRWSLIFSVDGEEGQKLLASYSNLASQHSPPLQGHVQLVPGGVSMVQRDPGARQMPPGSSTRHHVVAVGGTFDHIHAGHKLLLSATALLLQPSSLTSSIPRRLIVGITGASHQTNLLQTGKPSIHN